MYYGNMNKPLNLNLDRKEKVPLAEQIRRGMTTAIEDGVLEPGARLPSWQDLAAQLGVARGTVRTAYQKLAAAQLVEASRATGTRVARRPRALVRSEQPPDAGSFMNIYREMTQGPALFQMGVPAIETFPATLFARIRAHAVRAEASAPPIYPDPHGEFELRREIAGYLAVARGINCSPSQVIVTGGFSAGLGLALSVLGVGGHTAWVENPGFPFTRKGLELARLSLAPIPVDADGIDIDHGLRHHPDAKLVVVTPGQQAPLGPTLSLERRLRLLEWAAAILSGVRRASPARSSRSIAVVIAPVVQAGGSRELTRSGAAVALEEVEAAHVGAMDADRVGHRLVEAVGRRLRHPHLVDELVEQFSFLT